MEHTLPKQTKQKNRANFSYFFVNWKDEKKSRNFPSISLVFLANKTDRNREPSIPSKMNKMITDNIETDSGATRERYTGVLKPNLLPID
jgi:hypothetical protein